MWGASGSQWGRLIWGTATTGERTNDVAQSFSADTVFRIGLAISGSTLARLRRTPEASLSATARLLLQIAQDALVRARLRTQDQLQGISAATRLAARDQSLNETVQTLLRLVSQADSSASVRMRVQDIAQAVVGARLLAEDIVQVALQEMRLRAGDISQDQEVASRIRKVQEQAEAIIARLRQAIEQGQDISARLRLIARSLETLAGARLRIADTQVGELAAHLRIEAVLEQGTAAVLRLLHDVSSLAEMRLRSEASKCFLAQATLRQEREHSEDVAARLRQVLGQSLQQITRLRLDISYENTLGARIRREQMLAGEMRAKFRAIERTVLQEAQALLRLEMLRESLLSGRLREEQQSAGDVEARLRATVFLDAYSTMRLRHLTEEDFSLRALFRATIQAMWLTTVRLRSLQSLGGEALTRFLGELMSTLEAGARFHVSDRETVFLAQAILRKEDEFSLELAALLRRTIFQEALAGLRTRLEQATGALARARWRKQEPLAWEPFTVLRSERHIDAGAVTLLRATLAQQVLMRSRMGQERRQGFLVEARTEGGAMIWRKSRTRTRRGFKKFSRLGASLQRTISLPMLLQARLRQYRPFVLLATPDTELSSALSALSQTAGAGAISEASAQETLSQGLGEGFLETTISTAEVQ